MRQAEISSAPDGLPEDILKWEQSSGFEAQHARSMLEAAKLNGGTVPDTLFMAAFKADIDLFEAWCATILRQGRRVLDRIESQTTLLKEDDDA